MKFCKNCGHELRPDVKVCTNCGHKVGTGDQENNKLERQSEPKAPMDPKKKKFLSVVIAAIVILAIALAVTYNMVSNSLSPNNQLDAIAEAVSAEDAEALTDAVDNDITIEEAEAHISYINQVSGFSQYNSWIDAAKSDLDNGASGSEVYDGLYTLLSVNRDGSQYVIFDDYSFTIPRMNIYVSDQYDIDAFTYTLGDSEQQWDSGSEKFAELIPGIYSFEGSAVVDEESYDSTMSINFNEGETAVFEPGFFYLNISENVTSMVFEDISEENITVTVNDEAADVDLNDYENRVGPYAFDEEINMNATLEYAGETFESDTEAVQVSPDEIETSYPMAGTVPVHGVALEFDEDAIAEAGEAERNQAQVEEEREEFEADMEDNVETFVTDYLFALEMMYMFDDINEVDEFVDDDSDTYANLQDNLDSGTFEGMNISNITFSNFSQDGDTITIDVESERDYDSLDAPIDVTTRYTVAYDSEEVELEIAGFEDL